MVNEQELVLPLGSSAVAFTVVVPTGKLEPDAWSVVTVTLDEQLSVAVTVKLTVVEVAVEFGGKVTVMLLGQEITGAVVSTTFTVRVAIAVYRPSVAE